MEASCISLKNLRLLRNNFPLARPNLNDPSLLLFIQLGGKKPSIKDRIEQDVLLKSWNNALNQVKALFTHGKVTTKNQTTLL